MADRQRVTISESLPSTARDAALRYLKSPDDLKRAMRLVQGFGPIRFDAKAHRRSVALCAQASRRILFGWTEFGCEGDVPERTVDVADAWAQQGAAPDDWGEWTLPAPAVCDGSIIADCDACRVGPIAAAAARTIVFIHTKEPMDGAIVLCDAYGAALEGVCRTDMPPFEKWLVSIALTAAWELRDLTEQELQT